MPGGSPQHPVSADGVSGAEPGQKDAPQKEKHGHNEKLKILIADDSRSTVPCSRRYWAMAMTIWKQRMAQRQWN